MAETTVILNVRIPPKLRKQLERQAANDRTSLNRTAVEVLEVGLAALAGMRAEV